MNKITITEDNVELLTLEFKEKVPRQFSTKLDCVKFIMYFKVLFSADFKSYNDTECFDILYDMQLRALQMTCHTIKMFANDSNVTAAIEFLKDQLNTN